MRRSDFISLKDEVPETIIELAYAGTHNFVGHRLPGYEKELALFPKILLPHFENASTLAFKRGFRLKIFDAYRPQKAVDFFIEWSQQQEDREDLKQLYYPKFSRSELFNEGYLAARSSHSRGTAIDLTIVEASSLNDLDMGGHFDLFDETSHTHSELISLAQKSAREELGSIMREAGFINYSKEWWHFSIRPAPWDQYLNFDIA
ncbi:MAG TPA: M15 family metallopeptidase [Bacteriovoracaceae bacterium]|nr:M15 family metallopeptidase [Bacteriovoracaceae bacterium]